MRLVCIRIFKVHPSNSCFNVLPTDIYKRRKRTWLLLPACIISWSSPLTSSSWPLLPCIFLHWHLLFERIEKAINLQFFWYNSHFLISTFWVNFSGTKAGIIMSYGDVHKYYKYCENKSMVACILISAIFLFSVSPIGSNLFPLHPSSSNIKTVSSLLATFLNHMHTKIIMSGSFNLC